jgi:hypothetical protein
VQTKRWQGIKQWKSDNARQKREGVGERKGKQRQHRHKRRAGADREWRAIKAMQKKRRAQNNRRLELVMHTVVAACADTRWRGVRLE